MIHHLLFEGKINIQRRAFLWNMMASLTYSIQSALFLLIATRVAGKTAAGDFILLFTVAQTLNIVGNYYIRDFQASDVKEEYPFPTYFTARLATCGLMLLLGIGYGIWKQLPGEAFLVLMCLVIYRLIECIEDVFHGDIQRAGRLDVASICMTIRVVAASAAFCIVFMLSGSQVYASVVLTAVCGVLAAYLLHAVRTEFRARTPIRISWEKVAKLLTVCFPIFICTLLYTYLINAPKYAIADIMDGEAQTVFNIIFMPAFVITILSMFVFKPLIVKMSKDWNDGNYRQFGRGMIRQSIVVLSITAFVLLAGELIGLRMLEWVYGVGLSEYRGAFLLLLLFGGFSAMAFFANLVLTIIRAQKYMILEYSVALVISILTTGLLVEKHGIFGAALAYGCICTTQMVFSYSVMLIKMKKAGRTQQAGGI